MKVTEQSFTMLRRVPQGLVPLSAYDDERLSRFPMFADVRANLTMPRSLPRHRLYWLLLGIVADNQEVYRTAEDLHFALKVRLRYIEEFRLIGDEIIIRPRSTDFDSMDEVEFRQYMDGALEVIATEVIPGLDIDRLVEEGKRKLGMTGVERARAKGLPMLALGAA